MKRPVSALLAAATTLVLGVSAFAASRGFFPTSGGTSGTSRGSLPDLSGAQLIKESSYYDEALGTAVTQSLYFTPDPADAVLPAKAEHTGTPLPENLGELVSESSYYEKALGTTVTQRLYFLPDDPSDTAASRTANCGSGTYTASNTFQWADGHTTTAFAAGHFTWGGGKVDLDTDSYGYGFLPSDVSILYRWEGMGREEGGTPNVEARHTLTFQPEGGKKVTLDAYICVDANGNVTYSGS